MRIIRFDDLKTVPWKNGGGITREVAAERKDDAIVWRLSMADVDTDGAFSKFENLRRILTVTKGQGMDLISSETTLHANFAAPVLFDGEADITSRLHNGPIRDFNVIYDPKACRIDAAIWTAPHLATLAATGTHLWALHCITGEVIMHSRDRLFPGDTALMGDGYEDVVVSGDSCALVVSIDRLQQ